MTRRAQRFTYVGLEVSRDTVTGYYDSDGRAFRETVVFDGVGDLRTPATRNLATLWYLIAGLSYYKTGAAHLVDLRGTPAGPRGLDLLRAALVDGLGEFAYRNDLDLRDVDVVGAGEWTSASTTLDPARVLTPFGGGIDSIVSVSSLAADLDQALFVVSPSSGRFDALEAAAAVTGLPTVRATRSLDESLLGDGEPFLRGHVPVTAMVTLLASVAASADGRGGVVMSNEHSASVPNLVRGDRAINHQWSKSFAAELLIGDAVGEAVGATLDVASLLRDRTEVWVARRFSELVSYHGVFRSCNRAFAQSPSARATTWCGECDKCLFIDLVLAPFFARDALRAIFGAEPLASPAHEARLRTLVGLGDEHKPFDCVGDPDESATALHLVVARGNWADATHLAELARLVRPMSDPFEPRGPSRVPAHWLR